MVSDMPLVLTDEQAMLRDSARDFLAEQSPITALRHLRDSADADGFSRADASRASSAPTTV